MSCCCIRPGGRFGNSRVELGSPTRRTGHYTIPTLAGADGRGQIVAFLARNGRPVGTETIATFKQTAACGRDR